MASVAVVGAGICGLSSAVCILEKDPRVKVTLVADKFSPDTTSDGAAGLIMPFMAGDTPIRLQRKWFKVTIDVLKRLLQQEDAAKLGIFWVSGHILYDRDAEEPHWKNEVYGYHLLTKQDLANFSDRAKFGYGVTTIIMQGTPYMAYLMKRFKKLGGLVTKRTLNSLTELDSFDVVVNCSGIRAREVVGDLSVQPVRGQVLRFPVSNDCCVVDVVGMCQGYLPMFGNMIAAPWLKHFVIFSILEDEEQERHCYIIPQINEVVVGGTTQHGNFSEATTAEDTEHILRVTSQLYPSIKQAKVLKTWAGLRPARSSVRLEQEVITLRNASGQPRKLNVVHNYGHGGSGLTLHWGCALDTAGLVLDFLARGKQSKL